MKKVILLSLFMVQPAVAEWKFWLPFPFVQVGLTASDVSTAYTSVMENKGKAALISTAVILALYTTKKYWLPLVKNYLHPKPQTIAIEGLVVQADNDKESSSNNASSQDSMLKDFAKCKARVYQPHEISERMSDVAGNENAKLDLADIITYLQDPAPFKAMGAKVPKGVVMYGPPGTGKTMLAKAMAGEANCPFISISGSEFVEAIVGMGAARVRDLFKIAKELAPCIIFIDEIDALAHKRASTSFGGGADESSQTLAQLLVAMDGFDVMKKPIVIIGATNRFEALDPAILRPGRLDRKVHVALPTKKDRAAIVNVHIKKIATDGAIDVNRIAQATGGWSGADLANLMNEAAILAVNKKANKVTMNEINDAYDNIKLGRELLNYEQTPEELYETAIHEAGHTVATVFCKNNKYPLQKVTIQPRSNSLGITMRIPLNDVLSQTYEEFRADIIIKLSGRIAEELFGMSINTGAGSDLEGARETAYHMVVICGMGRADLAYMSYNEIDHQLPESLATKIHEEVQAIVHECQQEAFALLSAHKADIKKLADLLVQKKVVYGDEVYTLFGQVAPKIEYTLKKAKA